MVTPRKTSDVWKLYKYQKYKYLTVLPDCKRSVNNHNELVAVLQSWSWRYDNVQVKVWQSSSRSVVFHLKKNKKQNNNGWINIEKWYKQHWIIKVLSYHHQSHAHTGSDKWENTNISQMWFNFRCFDVMYSYLRWWQTPDMKLFQLRWRQSRCRPRSETWSCSSSTGWPSCWQSSCHRYLSCRFHCCLCTRWRSEVGNPTPEPPSSPSSPRNPTGTLGASVWSLVLFYVLLMGQQDQEHF